jgi:hypothetical protein
MAERLATEYVKTSLLCTEADLKKLVQCFAEHQIMLQVKVLENGSQEVVLEDGAHEEIVLRFEKQAHWFVCEGSCRFKQLNAANAMRKIVAMLKGDAVVHRIYPNYTVIYQYEQGKVVRIVEEANGTERLIFERKDRIHQLERLFNRRQVESRIQAVKQEINLLLDLRNMTSDPAETASIDNELRKLTHTLFVLEA